MDTRKSAFGLPHFILFDIIYFVFIAYEEKNIFEFLSKGGFNFYPSWYQAVFFAIINNGY